jgi:hypothetical protein
LGAKTFTAPLTLGVVLNEVTLGTPQALVGVLEIVHVPTAEEPRIPTPILELEEPGMSTPIPKTTGEEEGDEGDEEADVVIGTIPLYGKLASTLFYSGATHSFI